VPITEDDRTREELLAENVRLREELLRRRSSGSMVPVVLGLVVHIAMRPFLDPWLNSDSDAKVGMAIALLVVPVGFSGVMLVRALRARPD
jgi:hypothetical protein